VSQYQKGKTNLDFTKARDSEWQYGISWAMCKSAASVASERTAVYPAVLAAGWSIVQTECQRRERVEQAANAEGASRECQRRKSCRGSER